MIVSRLTFFDLFTDFINLERPKSSKSSADIVAEEIPSFFKRSDKNLYSVWLLAVITIPFIKQIYKKIGTSGIIG